MEPYVISADVYGVSPHEGRGGWTWYTGSSGWMYRLGIEGILGLSCLGDKLRLHPQIPTSWPDFKMVCRYGRSEYHNTPSRYKEARPMSTACRWMASWWRGMRYGWWITAVCLRLCWS